MCALRAFDREPRDATRTSARAHSPPGVSKDRAVKKQAFNTGQAHQAAVATWGRKRLVDRGGAVFDDRTGQDTPEQIGCLFADGVGLGKTWEALATIALLLAKKD